MVHAADGLLAMLRWVLAVLSAQLVLFILAGAWIQRRRERLNRFRIECNRRWERELVTFLYVDDRIAPFAALTPAERRLFIPFLLRTLAILAGREGAAIQGLYKRLRLSEGLPRRLRSRQTKVRALAALEVGTFQVEALYPRMREMLNDPVPFVAHTAARSLASSRRLEHAGPVLDWVLTQDSFQMERQLWVLEGFGPGFLEWLGARLEGQARLGFREWILYAKVAASTRAVANPDRLVAMLAFPDLEARLSALKALAAVGFPEAQPAVEPFIRDPEWVLRAHAALAIGVLAGSQAVPSLLDLMADPVFAVRRNAALSLSRLGAAGLQALGRLAEAADADPFARDLALDRLQWQSYQVRP